MTTDKNSWLAEIKFNAQGLIPAIAQSVTDNRILMMAWMNADSIQETVATGQAVYWSRSRQKLWRKGEESGHVQHVKEVRLDCDGDVIILSVEQTGGIACHTGRASCFYRVLKNDTWQTDAPVIRDPTEIYDDAS